MAMQGTTKLDGQHVALTLFAHALDIAPRCVTCMRMPQRHSTNATVKKPTSLVCVYRDIVWCRWSEILPEISKTGPFLVLSKSNGWLQAKYLAE